MTKMTYINVYEPGRNPGRVVDMDHSTDARYLPNFRFDLSRHFGDQQLDKDEFEARLRDAASTPLSPIAAPYGAGVLNADELATEFALLLLTTLEEGWDTDDRILFLGCDLGGRSALLAHAIACPDDWRTLVSHRVGRDDREFSYVALVMRGGRMAIVGYDAYSPGGEYVPLSHLAQNCSPALLWDALFEMLPAITGYLTYTPAEEVWGDKEEYAAVAFESHIPSDAPHFETLQGWKDRGEAAVTEARAYTKAAYASGDPRVSTGDGVDLDGYFDAWLHMDDCPDCDGWG
ncbi:hypothetical protein QP932_10635 [Corynebacterium freneyi]|uniref:hypothetical protein n=1 Tax=Corynebacterium freneyi TaxID=134034 RepID=UPI0025503856|nr:hypothetical protein [Corynebacterium freneyi]MDK8768947.1 hypothetical protein [Corynebacterium freneyi]